MSNVYSAQNALWREKLISLTKRLTDKELGRKVGSAGWTVGGLLGHIAFYDLRAVAILERWKKVGVTPSPLDIDTVNDATRPLFSAVAPGEMKQLVVDAAVAVDDAIDALDLDFLSLIETEGKPFRLNRAAHREHHLQQIEKALA